MARKVVSGMLEGRLVTILTGTPMPTLFISYKRGTAAVAPLMERLRKAKYRLWFDRDEIHLGDSDWQARIDQGIAQCDGLILNLTPAACESEPVQYEVRQALAIGKPIFPIVLEKLPDWGAALTQVGLTPSQHMEDFTDVTQWDAQVQRLLRDLEKQKLHVTRHDLRHERDLHDPRYALHQTFLRRLVDQVGTLNLAQINPEGRTGIDLEAVYVDSPVNLSIGVEVKDWQIVDWWLSRRDSLQAEQGGDRAESIRHTPEEFGYERAPLEALLNRLTACIEDYRQQYPNEKPDDLVNRWHNGAHDRVQALQVQDITAACDRLMILGGPGSGKSTFVRHLALCLAGAQLSGWSRPATLEQLGIWPHGALTPIYIELRRFVASQHFPVDVYTPATADHLWAYIRVDLLGEALAAYAPDLQLDLQEGQAVLILDGLDEVPYPEGQLAARQTQLSALVQSLQARYGASRLIVTSRPYAYEGWSLPGFQKLEIAAFEDEHRHDLAQHLYTATELEPAIAQKKAQALIQQLRRIDPELKDRPLFVTLMATLYLKGDSEGLPTRRGTLYRASILLLLEYWTQGKSGSRSLSDILGTSNAEAVFDRLAALAYAVHSQYGDQPGTPEIDEGQLYSYLNPLGRGPTIELIPYLSENAGVLVSSRQNTHREVFNFAHRSFQEYLSASQVVSQCLEADDFSLIRDLIQSKPQAWRVPGELVGDVLVDAGRTSDLWDLLDDLLEDDISGTDLSAADPRWWSIWLAGRIADEQGLAAQTRLRKSERAIRENLVDWLVKLLQTPQALNPVDRAACGRALGLLGDPRPYIGLNAEGLPDIDWVTIPGGKFIYQEGEKLTLPMFEISRYPVTHTQFQAFVDASDYNDERWWAGIPEEEVNHATIYRTREMAEQSFQYGNHPREMVSWYQAIAFCRWLSAELGYTVRLPTEQEWEKAARGTNGLKYPYGNEFDSAKANTRETGIGQTSAVGIFPEGATPYGVQDMSGNVWEWCLNKYDNPEHLLVDNSGDWRVLRGGAWGFNHDNARSALRRRQTPDVRNFHSLGFRLVCVP